MSTETDRQIERQVDKHRPNKYMEQAAAELGEAQFGRFYHIFQKKYHFWAELKEIFV